MGGAGGAATGATAGAVHGTAKSVGPGPIYKGFVDRCLRDRGYQVIGCQQPRPRGYNIYLPTYSMKAGPCSAREGPQP